jgi:hypothetical protein
MVCFQTQNPNFGKNFRASDWKMLIYFMVIWNILWISGIFCDHSVHIVLIWYIFSCFGIMHQEKSGNTGVMFVLDCKRCVHSPYLVFAWFLLPVPFFVSSTISLFCLRIKRCPVVGNTLNCWIEFVQFGPTLLNPATFTNNIFKLT